MTISTLAGVIAGVQAIQPCAKNSQVTNNGNYSSWWYPSGTNGPGVADTSTAGGVARSSTAALVAGQIPFYDPAGANRTYLARLSTMFPNVAVGSGIALLCDRLWDCGAKSNGSAIDVTSVAAQTINSTAWPTRDNNGSANGDGVLIGVEVSSTMGAGTPTFTLSYTNSAGTAGRSATTIQTITGAAQGIFLPFTLQSGDVGVRSVETIQADASWVSGQYVLVAYRVMCGFALNALNRNTILDSITSGFPRFLNGSVPFMLITSNVTSGGTRQLVSITYTQG